MAVIVMMSIGRAPLVAGALAVLRFGNGLKDFYNRHGRTWWPCCYPTLGFYGRQALIC